MLYLSRALPGVCSLLVVMVAVCKCMCLLYDMRKKKGAHNRTCRIVHSSHKFAHGCSRGRSEHCFGHAANTANRCVQFSTITRGLRVCCNVQTLQPCWCRDHTYSTNATAATSRRMLHKMMSAASVSLACIAVAVITQMVSATIALLGNLHQDQLRTFQH